MSDTLTLKEFKVLKVLQADEMYGIQIIRAIEDAGGGRMVMGTFYNLGRLLEKKGFLEIMKGTNDEDPHDKKRKYYKITAKGKKALLHFESEVSGFSLKLKQAYS